MVFFAILMMVIALFCGIKYLELKIELEKLWSEIEFLRKNHAFLEKNIFHNGKINQILEQFHILQMENLNLEKSVKKNTEEYRKLMSDLSHDLRTPLTSLSGYLALIHCREESQRYLQISKEKAIFLQQLIEKFYELSLSKEGKPKFSYEFVQPLVSQVALTYYDDFQKKHQEIRIHIDDSIKIFTAKKEMEIILRNIIENMLKYSLGNNEISVWNKNGLIFIFSNDTDLEDGRYERLLLRSEVIDTSRKHSTGLGLAIVKSYCERLNFDVKVYVGGGKFYLILKEKMISSIQ